METATKAEEEFKTYSIPKFARLIGISESSIRRGIANGRIRTVVLNSHPRVTHHEVKRLLKIVEGRDDDE